MKTAMKELIEMRKRLSMNEFDTWLLSNIEKLLQLEENQFLDTYHRGEKKAPLDFEFASNQTYNQKQHIIDIMKADEDDGLYNPNK